MLIDRPETRDFARTHLAEWYPGASVAFLAVRTRGAALSALAAVATGRDFAAPMIVDLADILYSGVLNPVAAFSADADLGAVALTFRANNPVYSYLRTDADGRFVEAAEKRVISNEASAGTYLFRDTPVFLRALAHGMENEETQTFRDSFFVCPLLNGVRAQGKTVLLESVGNVHDIKVDPIHA